MRRFMIVAVALPALVHFAWAAEQKPFATPAPYPASVKVTHVQPIVSVEAADLTTDPLPEFLAGATALTRPVAKYKDDAAAGRIEIEATADGPLFLAVCYEPDGKIESKWKSEIWSEKKFLDGDWLLVAELKLINSTEPTPQKHLVWVRQCTAGEEFVVRTRRTHPPIVLVADPKRVKTAYDFEPDTSLAEFRQSATITQKMNLLLGARRFEDLERWMTKYVDDDPMFASGRYKIKATNKFYTHGSSSPETQKIAQKYLDDAEAWLAAKPESLAAQLVLGRLLVDYARIAARNGDKKYRVDELRRRGLELVYGVGEARPKLTDVHRTHVMQMIFEEWDVNLSKDMVLKAIDSGAWCPQVVGEGLMHIYTRLPSGPERTKQVRAFFDECVARTPEKYRAAMPAACFKDLPIFLDFIEALGITWPKMRAGYEALEELFPDSSVNALSATIFACREGDHEFAARMLARFDEFKLRDVDVWTEGDVAECRMWAAPNYAAGDQRLLFEYGNERVKQVQWLPDGRVFLGSSGGKLRSYDPQTGVWTSHGWLDSSAYTYIRLLPDGKTVASGNYDGFATLSAFPSRETIFRAWLPNRSRTDIVAVSPDARRLVVADYSKSDLVLFDNVYEAGSNKVVETRRRTKAWDGKIARLIAYCDEGRHIVGYDYNGTVHILRSDDLELVKRWEANTKAPPATACISADGKRLATCGGDQFVRVWSLPDGEQLAEFPFRGDRLGSLALSPDGHLLAGGEAFYPHRPCSVHLWDVDAKQKLESLTGHKAGIHYLDFSADGRSLLSASADKSIRVWNVPTK